MIWSPNRPAVVLGGVSDFFKDPLGSTSRTLGRVQKGLFGWRADQITETEIHESTSESKSAQTTGLMVAGAAIIGVALIAVMKKKRGA